MILNCEWEVRWWEVLLFRCKVLLFVQLLLRNVGRLKLLPTHINLTVSTQHTANSQNEEIFQHFLKIPATATLCSLLPVHFYFHKNSLKCKLRKLENSRTCKYNSSPRGWQETQNTTNYTSPLILSLTTRERSKLKVLRYILRRVFTLQDWDL